MRLSPDVKGNGADPNPRKASNNRFARAASRPVTTSARRPNSRASGPARPIAPAPKMMRVAVANSNRMRDFPRLTSFRPADGGCRTSR